MNMLDTTLLSAQMQTQQAATPAVSRFSSENKQMTLAQATAKLSAAQLKKIDETARDFEAVFMSEMIKPMFEGVKTDGEFGGGQAEEMFRGIMVQEYGKSMALTNSIGISDQVKAQMIQTQAAANL